MKYVLFLLCLLILYINYIQKNNIILKLKTINDECSNTTIEKASINMERSIPKRLRQAIELPERQTLVEKIFDIQELINSIKIKSDKNLWKFLSTKLQNYSKYIGYQKCDSIPSVKNIEDALYIFNVLLNNTYIDDIFLNKTAIIQTDSSKYQLIGLHMNPLKVKLNGKEISSARIKDSYFYFFRKNKNNKVNKLKYISFNPVTNKTDTHVYTIEN